MSGSNSHPSGPGADPSMEDILASIRRILSEEETHPTAPGVSRAPRDAAPAPHRDEAADPDGDVLLLDNSMLVRDPPPPEPMTLMPPEPEAEAPPPPVVMPFGGAYREEAAEHEPPAVHAIHSAAETVSAEPGPITFLELPADEPVGEPPLANALMDAQSAFDTPDRHEAMEVPPGHDEPARRHDLDDQDDRRDHHDHHDHHEEPSSVFSSVSPQPESSFMSASLLAQPPITSSDATTAAAGAITNLVRTLTTDRAAQVSSTGPTIADIVREEMRPMLKSWLDNNLPPLVERLVRSEIDRVIARAVQ